MGGGLCVLFYLMRTHSLLVFWDVLVFLGKAILNFCDLTERSAKVTHQVVRPFFHKVIIIYPSLASYSLYIHKIIITNFINNCIKLVNSRWLLSTLVGIGAWKS